MNAIARHIPVLETERLRLRAFQRADFDAYAGVLTSERARYMSGACDREAAEAYFHQDIASWILDGFGYWSIVRKADDAPVAFVGVSKLERFPERELGWFATADGEGHGFVAEAAEAVLDWAFLSQAMPTLVSYIDEGNTRSIALAERLGATLDEYAARPDPEDLVYRHPPRAA